jgi:hypothetical protein
VGGESSDEQKTRACVGGIRGRSKTRREAAVQCSWTLVDERLSGPFLSAHRLPPSAPRALSASAALQPAHDHSTCLPAHPPRCTPTASPTASSTAYYRPIDLPTCLPACLPAYLPTNQPAPSPPRLVSPRLASPSSAPSSARRHSPHASQSRALLPLSHAEALVTPPPPPLFLKPPRPRALEPHPRPR